MPEPKNRVGLRYGLLTPIRYDHKRLSSGVSRVIWECVCDCGGTIITTACALQSGATTSCGCRRTLNANKASKHALETGNYHRESGRFRGDDEELNKPTAIYKRWKGIISRCASNIPRTRIYYKDRGIQVCDAWASDYLSFKAWCLANGFQKDLQIDRIDNDKGYSPDNCRFVTPKEQAQNRRRAGRLKN